MQNFINIDKIAIIFEERNQIIVLKVQNYYNSLVYLYMRLKKILYFVYRKSTILVKILINISVKALIIIYIFSIYLI